MLYISTDYVFSGKQGEAPYAATATPRPGTVYGMTKLEGERAVEEAYRGKGMRGARGRGVVLRVPLLYGRGESAVGALVETVWRAQREEVVVDDWARRWPTGTEDVGRVVVGEFALSWGCGGGKLGLMGDRYCAALHQNASIRRRSRDRQTAADTAVLLRGCVYEIRDVQSVCGDFGTGSGEDEAG